MQTIDYIPERQILNAIKADGWIQIDPRGRAKPSPFVRKINGETCESYGHFKKGDKLACVFSTDRRYGSQQGIVVRTIQHPADFTGGSNQWANGISGMREILRRIERA